MPTKRLTCFAVAAALCGGCGTLTDRMTEAVNSTTVTRPTIAVGQTFDEAKNLLMEAGAKDVTYAIGVIIYGPGEHHWFQLRDGKRLYVRVVEVGEPTQLVIDNLALGDKNTNHIKEREIARLELR
jgi:hypothetical protein